MIFDEDKAFRNAYMDKNENLDLILHTGGGWRRQRINSYLRLKYKNIRI
jgi:hypothetical protein